MTATPEVMTPPASRRRARKGEGELLREEILDAAEALLIEKGHPDAVSIRAVAARVGVSPPAIYLHFADKDELFFHSCARNMEELADRLVAAGQEGSMLERLEAMGRAYIRFGLERGERYEVMFVARPPQSIVDDPEIEIPGVRALRATEAVVAAGIESGELRADLDPAATAASLWAAVHGTVLVLLGADAKPGFEMPADEQVIESTIEMVRSGLQAR
jgi:AcrR family transcriptional regulator